MPVGLALVPSSTQMMVSGRLGMLRVGLVLAKAKKSNVYHVVDVHAQMFISG